MSQMLADICASSSEYTQNTQRRFHKQRRFHNMEFASLPKTGAVTQGVIKGHVKIHRTTVDFVSICYVCKTSAVHSNDFSNRQKLSQAENALLIFDYY